MITECISNAAYDLQYEPLCTLVPFSGLAYDYLKYPLCATHGRSVETTRTFPDDEIPLSVWQVALNRMGFFITPGMATAVQEEASTD